MSEMDFNFSVKLKNKRNERQKLWIMLPCTKSYFEKEIANHFDGNYEMCVDEVKCSCVDLNEYYHEYNLNKLNYLSSLLQDLSSSDRKKISIIQEEGSYTKSIDELVNTILNIDYFEFIDGINSFEDLSNGFTTCLHLLKWSYPMI